MPASNLTVELTVDLPPPSAPVRLVALGETGLAVTVSGSCGLTRRSRMLELGGGWTHPPSIQLRHTRVRGLLGPETGVDPAGKSR